MATFHTDYLLGNDTTGNGSAALPYKTISKACSVSTANDTIKIAGSTLSDVPGLTLTSAGASLYTYTANIDPTGLIAEGDCISLTDPLWGADKFFFRVVTIVGTTVTLSMPSLPGIAMSVRKFSQIHYATSTALTTFESGGSIPSGVQLLGGWNSDFTEQNGWTVVRYQNTSTSSPSGTFMGIGPGGSSTYRDRFAIFNMTVGFTGSIYEEIYGDMIFVRVSNTMGATPITNRNNVKWYYIYSDVQGGTISKVNSNGTFGLTLSEFYTIKSPIPNSGIRNISLGVDNLYQQTTITGGGDITTTNTGLLASQLGGIYGDVYLNIIPSGDHYIKIMPGTSGIQYLWNGRLIFPNQSTVLQDDGGFLVWNNPTQNTSNFKYWTNANTSPPFSNDLGAIFAYDSEGTKVNQYGNGLQFADTSTYVTGTNSLRSQRIGRGAGQTGVSNIGQFLVNSATTQVNITITVKNDSASNITETFRVFPTGVVNTPAIQTTQAVNNNWTTFTWTITNADTIASMKTRLNIVTWVNSFNASSNFLWIDDVVITQS